MDAKDILEYHRDRIDVAAEKFRAYLQHISYGATAGIFAALLKFSPDTEKLQMLVWAFALSSASLFMIGLSWNLQKTKNTRLRGAAKRSIGEYEELKGKYKTLLYRNQVRDLIAFSFLVIAFILAGIALSSF